jgi:hypothetical protein
MIRIWAVLIVSILSIFVAQRYFELPPETAGIICGGFITVLGSILTIVIGRQNEIKMNIEKQVCDKKLQIYQDLVDHLLDFRTDRDDNTSDPVKRARDMTRSLITWGSEDALKKWINYIVALRGDWKDDDLEERLKELHPKMLKNFLNPKAEAILAIRKELGHTNKGLSRDDVLTIFVPFIQRLRELQKEDRSFIQRLRGLQKEDR